VRWDDVNARARGLATHLLGPADFADFATVRTREALLQHLAARAYPLPAGGIAPDPDAFDRLVGDVTAGRLALLSRWLGPRQEALGVMYELEERQAVRALLRGVVQGLSPTGRLRAATPTPALPRAALERLAAASSPADLAQWLLRLGHPVGRALQLALAAPLAPGLLGLELAITRTFAARARRAARRGGRVLRSFASWTIDLENVCTLLQAEAWRGDLEAEQAWLPGGRALPLARFASLAAGDPAELPSAFESAFAGLPFGAMLGAPDLATAGLERRVLSSQIAWCRTLARLQPLGPAGVLLVVGRIRAEAHDIRALAWGIELGAPANEIAGSLVAGP
jgi:hypothetical protein